MTATRRRLGGALTLAGLAVLVLVLWQRPDPFASPRVVDAAVSDASGLAAIGADVRVAGVPVGRVTGVQRSGTHAELTLTLDQDPGTIHDDATVALRPRLMFEGTAYIVLTLGHRDAPPLGARTIGLAHSSVYVPLDQALSTLGGRSGAHLRSVAASMASGVTPASAHALRRVLGAAPGLLSDGATVAAAAQGPSRTELHTAVAALGRDAAAVAGQAPALGATLDGAARTGAAVQTGSGHPLDATLQALPRVTGLLRSGAGAATAIVSGARTLIPALIPGARAMGPTLATVRPLLRRAVPVTQGLVPVLRSAQRAVTGLRNGAAPAGAAIAALAPTLTIFRDGLLTALARPTDLGTPAYLAFLGLFAGGGGASRPFGVDGAGHFMRFGLRFLTGAGQPLPPCTLLTQLSPALGQSVSRYGGCTP